VIIRSESVKKLGNMMRYRPRSLLKKAAKVALSLYWDLGWGDGTTLNIYKLDNNGNMTHLHERFVSIGDPFSAPS
jgi:hypothetical protein